MAGTVLGPGDTEVNHSGSNMCYNGVYNLVGEKNKAQTSEIHRMARPHPAVFPSISAVVCVSIHELIFISPTRGSLGV